MTMSCASKARFLTEADALAEVEFAQAHARSRVRLSVYACLCGSWHLTKATEYTERVHEKTARKNPSAYNAARDPNRFRNTPTITTRTR